MSWQALIARFAPTRVAGLIQFTRTLKSVKIVLILYCLAILVSAVHTRVGRFFGSGPVRA